MKLLISMASTPVLIRIAPSAVHYPDCADAAVLQFGPHSRSWLNGGQSDAFLGKNTRRIPKAFEGGRETRNPRNSISRFHA